MSRKTLHPAVMLLVVAGLILSLVISLPASVAASPAPAVQPNSSIQVESTLTKQFQENGSAGYLIYLDNSTIDLQAALKMNWNERGQFVMKTLQKSALDKQAKVRAYLDAQGIKYQAFWIDNVIAVDSSSQQVFNGLMSFPEIQSLKARRTMGVIEPKRESTSNHITAIEANLTHINADDAWGLGYTGTGFTVANIDTGVRFTHQAVNAQYRGNLGGSYEHNYNWFDPYGDHPTEPGDDNGHGTHTMGIMVGDDGSANQIGVAPDASWMACRGCNTSSCTDAALLACAQFIAAPTDLAGANADPAKRPVAVNNSWGDCSTSYDSWYQGVVDAWHAAGIYPVFSNGNASNCGYSEPPGLNTVGNPARYGNVTGVGSSGQSDGQYASHSNWGPTDNLDTVNPSPADAFGAALKPQVIAPGVNIRSSVNTSDSSYESWGGTSMSAPHVTGLIALVAEAAPCLAGDYAGIETLLEDTAVPIPYDTGGVPAPPTGNDINYATGHGEIDALAAVQAAATMCGGSVLSGTVTDSATGDPVVGAKVDVVNLTTNRHVTTNATGFYTLNLFDGTYDITVSKYAYITQTISSVTLTGTATQDVSLVPAPSTTISGVVTDGTTGWPLYARIDITGNPGGPIFTDPVTGAYTVTLPSGDYPFTVTALSGGYTPYTATLSLSVSGTQDFALTADLVACTAPGYVPSPPAFSEDFETWPLTGWTIVDNIVAGGLVWDSSDAYLDSNLTGGAGLSADVNSDKNSGVDYDTELITPLIDPTTLPNKVMTYQTNFRKYSLGSEAFDLEIKNDGDVDWTNISHWTATQAAAKITVDLTSYITGNFQLRWHYYTPESGPWDFYTQVDEVAIGVVCQPIASGGLVVGAVYDANTTDPVGGATVHDEALNQALFVDNSADTSQPHIFVLAEPAGAVLLTASTAIPGYEADSQTPTVVAGDTIRQDFQLPAGKLASNPTSLAFTVSTAAPTQSKSIKLNNTGTAAADFTIFAVAGTYVPAAGTGPFAKQTAPAGKVDLTATNTSKLPNSFAALTAQKINGGAVSASWDSGLVAPWGIGFNTGATDLWVGDISDYVDYRFTTAGVNTGDQINTLPWVGVFGADMAYNPFTKTLWQVNVGGDNCIYELNPVTKAATGATICPAFGASERGLAFDPVTNTYYAGSWTDGVINHFAPNGTLLDSTFVGMYVAGLAYNPSTGHLFVMTNNATTSNGAALDVYVVDTAHGYMTLGGFNLVDGTTKAFDDYQQAGLEIDCAGNLWAPNQVTGKVYVASSGETGVCDWQPTWLTVTPASSSVGAGSNSTVTVAVNATGLKAGVHNAFLRIASDTPYGDVVVPITLTVNGQATFASVGANDGWVLESSQSGNKGGSLNASAKTFQVGDDALNRQFKAILSFDTSKLPAGAVITGVQLRIKQSGAPVGQNPFIALGKLLVDIKQGSFGTKTLELGDWQATATTKAIGKFGAPAGGWYTATLPATAKINRAGVTQFRLYFTKADNNNHLDNYMKFFSGNNATFKPQLIITYTLP